LQAARWLNGGVLRRRTPRTALLSRVLQTFVFQSNHDGDPMTRFKRPFLLAFVVLVVWHSRASSSILLARAPKNQQYDEAIRSAQNFEILGCILAAVGILFVVAGIPVGIYLDRRKKARKRARQSATEGAPPSLFEDRNP
jgi:hypothetical protein